MKSYAIAALAAVSTVSAHNTWGTSHVNKWVTTDSTNDMG